MQFYATSVSTAESSVSQEYTFAFSQHILNLMTSRIERNDEQRTTTQHLWQAWYFPSFITTSVVEHSTFTVNNLSRLLSRRKRFVKIEST